MNKATTAAQAPGTSARGGGGYTMEEVAKHTTKGSCCVVAGQVLNVTNFLSEHPGGELAILTFAWKDATQDLNMIHPPDVIPKYAPDALTRTIGGSCCSGGAVALPPGMSAYTMDEVAKHTSKTDCSVVVARQVLNVTSFLSQHPGGELVILTFTRKDATKEFNMIHPPNGIRKHAPDVIIGMVGTAAATQQAPASSAQRASARADKEHKLANHQAWGDA